MATAELNETDTGCNPLRSFSSTIYLPWNGSSILRNHRLITILLQRTDSLDLRLKNKQVASLHGWQGAEYGDT